MSKYITQYGTTDAAYKAGKAVGAEWKDKYRPGGPHIIRDEHATDLEWIAFCNQTKMENAAWLRGFDESCTVL